MVTEVITVVIFATLIVFYLFYASNKASKENRAIKRGEMHKRNQEYLNVILKKKSASPEKK